MIILPEKTPVLVFASYRTGSTALCDNIARQNSLQNFDEALHPLEHPLLIARKKRFLDCLNSGDTKFVIKLMPDHITEAYQPLVDRLSHSAYLIRITRRSVIEQIASFYIASTSNIWHQTQRRPRQDYDLPLDKSRLQKAKAHILKTNRDLAAMPYGYHLDLVYEDISFDTQFMVYKKPGNYQALLDAVTDLMSADTAPAI
jgi:LPS sulfotransferase NodH